MTPYPGQAVLAGRHQCRVIRLVYEGGSPFLVDPPRAWLVERIKDGRRGVIEERLLRCDVRTEIAEAMELLADASE